jgi:extracellular factor (EF) 3-hydroxypalmitic acid methyl ester biosynthesis protein
MFHSGVEMNQVLTGNGNGSNGHLQHAKKQAAPPAPVPSSGDKESRVTFRTVEGAELQGALVRFTRYSAVFELYNPSQIPRFSEVIDDFVILLQGRTIYSGRAVVRNVMDAETKIICKATLDESHWKDLKFSLAMQREDGTAKEFKIFLKEWQKLYKVSPEFKVIIADMHTFLSDLRLWLEQVESLMQGTPPIERAKREREVARQLEPAIVPAIQNLFERFEEISNQLEEDLRPAHWAFGKRLVHPLLLCSPFVHRTFYKPLGYPGDYEMVNMMFRDPFEGESLFAKMVNLYALQLPPIVGHRNRIRYLGEKLERESLRVMVRRRDARVFSMGCGPAQEVQCFLAENELANHTHFTLADFNQETLKQTGAILGGLKQKHSRRGSIQMVRQSVQQLLKAAGRNVEYPRCDQHDLIYCAGLFDYVTDQVCRQLMDVFYAMLAPGGLLIATNVDNHPAVNQMACFLDWHLLNRDTNKMRTIVPHKADLEKVSIKQDSSGVNVFMEIRKPNGEE